jgi:hypothetical protein
LRHERFHGVVSLAPVAPTAADDDYDQAERQVDTNDLPDAVEAGAGARPVLDIDGAVERQPRPVEQPDDSAIISQPIICIRWMYGLAAAKPPKVVNSIQ